MSEKTRTYKGIRITGDKESNVSDELTVEEALTIFLNDDPLTVTMQTPGNELELARGLLFTEGILKSRTEDFPAKVAETNKSGNITAIRVQLDGVQASAISKRSLLSVSACGICGKTEIDFVTGKLESTGLANFDLIPQMFDQMKDSQQAFLSSGGCHAAAAFNSKGKMLSVREDVGRHNAVDKVIGALLFEGRLSEARFLLVSGRVSYEIIAKTFAAGIPVLAAVSAPSSLAVDFCKELGITLFGFCRENRMTRYS
ncbi:MAG: formate dehydrogenase accessory sulfurtransferase FdhD [Flavobacteriales bacterium]